MKKKKHKRKKKKKILKLRLFYPLPKLNHALSSLHKTMDMKIKERGKIQPERLNVQRRRRDLYWRPPQAEPLTGRRGAQYILSWRFLSSWSLAPRILWTRCASRPTSASSGPTSASCGIGGIADLAEGASSTVLQGWQGGGDEVA